MVLEHGELRRVLQLVVRAVLVGEEQIDLRGGELVRVAGVDLHEHRIARLHVLALTGEQLRGEDLLGEVHRPRRGAGRGHRDLFLGEPRAERQQAAALDDERRDRVVTARELAEWDRLTGFEAANRVVVAHQLTDVDVVARVNRRERARDRESAAREHFALRGLLAARADALLRAGDDHFEAAVRECTGRDQPLAADDEAGVGVLRDLVRIEVEAHPRGGHRVGIDVVEQIVGRHVAHAQRERAGELLANAFGILREIEDALAGGERETTIRHAVGTLPLQRV